MPFICIYPNFIENLHKRSYKNLTKNFTKFIVFSRFYKNSPILIQVILKYDAVVKKSKFFDLNTSEIWVGRISGNNS